MLHWLYHLHLSKLMLTSVVCFITGFVPTVGTEVFLVVLALKTHGFELLTLIVIAASAFQMLSKVIIYYLGFGVIGYLPKSLKEKIDNLSHKYSQKSLTNRSLIFISALIGVPPFYIINILCGAFKVPFNLFFSMGLLGTFIRFAFVVFLPHVFMQLHAIL